MTDNSVKIVNLSKSFGDVKAVKNVSFSAAPGRVTGFLGPNGSGKTTTLQMLLGLIRADAGEGLIGGQKYSELTRPAVTVGAALSASFHPAHTGLAHLKIQAAAAGIPKNRIAEVLDLVGMTAAAKRKTGGYSLGMKQRLALATALLGDPRVLILDEPINGLDPEGIRWIREFLKFQAAEGRTVLLSSHLLSEVEQSVDDVVVISEGEIKYEGTLAGLRDMSASSTLRVDALNRQELQVALTKAGAEVQGIYSDGPLRVSGIDAEGVGKLALNEGVVLTHLSTKEAALETSFLELVAKEETAK